MSDPAAHASSTSRLPPRLRPLTRESPGSGRLRLVETTLLVLAAVLLATATINDVGRQVGVNHRLQADMNTWRAYTGHAYHNLDISQELLGSATGHEVVCGNTAPGAPKARTQLCLVIWGPVAGGRRIVHGGWYLPAGAEDEARLRYGCFGAGASGLCPGR
jgi:hypothetical protein